MKSNVIKIDFATPAAINLDDKVNLRDIHIVLKEKGGVKTNSNFRDWVKKKLEHYQPADFITAAEKIATSGGEQNCNEYYTTVQVAMEILANGHGKVGHDMRQFMSRCVRKVVENQIELPFDMHDPESILNWAQGAFAKERQLRLVAENKVVEIEREKEVYREATVQLAPYKEIVENVTQAGEWVGSTEAIKLWWPKAPRPVHTVRNSITRAAKALMRERGWQWRIEQNHYQQDYAVFPPSLLKTVIDFYKKGKA